MRIQGWVAAMALLTVAACSDAPTEPKLAPAGADARAARSLRPAETPTVVDVALTVNGETGEFSTLIAAVVAADLVDALSARGQRTVFAPTDAAFAELGLNAGNIAGALDTETLTDILLYHVAPGRRAARSVVNAKQIRMLNGGFNDIWVDDSGAYIGGARIIQADVEATNGIIHVIDSVLLPE
jgi:uncharacterized surface protein with fasciclin (FAS1) repeats